MSYFSQMSVFFIVLVVYTISSCTGDDCPSMAGGWNCWKNVDPEVTEIAQNLRSEVEAKHNGANQYSQYVPVKYKSQVVAGTNYRIKIQVGENQFIVAKVFKPLPYTRNPPELTSVVDFDE